jgi:phosphatidylglycerophosphate synthase
MYLNSPWSIPVAGVVFILASLTDTLDGYIARKHNLVTDFGKFLDPVIIIVARELIVTTFRCSAALKNKVLAADFFGKLKTIFQLVALSGMHFESVFYNWGIGIGTGVKLTMDILFYISLFLTVYSGINYVMKNKEVLFEDQKG